MLTAAPPRWTKHAPNASKPKLQWPRHAPSSPRCRARAGDAATKKSAGTLIGKKPFQFPWLAPLTTSGSLALVSEKQLGFEMKSSHLSAAALAIGMCLFAAGAQAQLTVQTERIGTFMPELPDSTSVPVARRHVLGTDLGFTATWRGGAIMLFGDSIPSELSPPAASVADLNHDDAWGFWSLAGTSFNAVPTAFTMFAKTTRVITRSGNDLIMAGARTPAAIASFNETFWWGLFARVGAYMVCSRDSDCQGLTCDTALRLYTPPTIPGFAPPNPMVCIAANPACASVTQALGVCRDTSTNNPMRNFTAPATPYNDTVGSFTLSQDQQRKVLTAATIHEFGPNTSTALSSYSTVPWITNKFTNATMHTTRAFNDFRAPPLDPTTDNALWIWGRPSYWSNTSRNAPGEIFLAGQNRSKLPATGTLPAPLSLSYRKADGLWSPNQNDAAKLTAVDGWADGVVGHMSVTYLEGPKKWLMVYGGGIPTAFDAVGGPLPASLGEAQKTDGTIKMRLADLPWGPWSAPVQALSPFDDNTNDDGDDGICHHLHDGGLGTNDRCGGHNLPPSQFPGTFGPGSLYGVSVIDGWTTWDATTRKAKIGWVVSTWNPYEVHQMKSTITIP